jgi:HSP20 family protein
MSALERRTSRGIFPDLFDFFESPFAVLRTGGAQAMRVEDFADGDDHVIRAEMPGIAPGKDAPAASRRRPGGERR